MQEAKTAKTKKQRSRHKELLRPDYQGKHYDGKYILKDNELITSKNTIG